MKLMPGVHLHNPNDQQWTHLSLAINKQFYFYSPTLSCLAEIFGSLFRCLRPRATNTIARQSCPCGS